LGARRAIALGGCVVLLISGIWLAVAAADNDWLVDSTTALEPHWALGPLTGILPDLTDPTASALLLVMLAGWLLALTGVDELPDRLLLGTAGALVLLFTLTSPILSSDIFGYVAYARLGTVAGLNPYTHGADALGHIPLLSFVYWKSARSPYGPLFTLLSYPLGPLSLAAATWTLKALAGVGALCAIVFTTLTARRMGRPPGPAVFLLWANPLLVAYGLGGGHNDLIVAGVACGAIWALVRGHEGASGVAMIAAAGVKATGALVALFALARPGVPRRRMLTGALAGVIALATVTLIAFGTHLPNSAAVATSSTYVASWSGADLLGRVLGTGATAGVRGGLFAGAVLLCVVMLWRVARGRTEWTTGATVATFGFLGAVVSLVPWYLAWLAPVAPLARQRPTRITLAVLTIYMTVTRLPIFGASFY
jgi:alpha-1,6-mannosyltransferase